MQNSQRNGEGDWGGTKGGIDRKWYERGQLHIRYCRSVGLSDHALCMITKVGPIFFLNLFLTATGGGLGQQPLGWEHSVSRKPVIVRKLWGKQSWRGACLQQLVWDLKSQVHVPGTCCHGAEEGLCLLQICCVQDWGALHGQTSSSTSLSRRCWVWAEAPNKQRVCAGNWGNL